MWPILFEIGGHAVHAWGAFGALGFLVVAGVGLWRSERAGIRVDHATDALLAAAFSGVIGARGLYVLHHLGDFESKLEWFDVRAGGASFFGALLVAVPVATAVGVLRGLPLLRGWDAFAPAMGLGFAMARIGCFAAGCCFGSPTRLPWGVVFPGHLGPVHPAQLYEAGFQVALSAVLLARGRHLREGESFAVWLGATGAGRFLIEFVRGDPGRAGMFGLTEPQGFALVALGLATVLAVRIRRA